MFLKAFAVGVQQVRTLNVRGIRISLEVVAISYLFSEKASCSYSQLGFLSTLVWKALTSVG